MQKISKKRACDRCHFGKRLCKGGLPCWSCKKLNTECTFKRPINKNGRPRTRVGKKEIESSQKQKYSHNGCVNCKLRKKKCDENWPICGSCHRQNVTCSGDISEGNNNLREVAENRTSLHNSLELPLDISENCHSSKEKRILDELLFVSDALIENSYSRKRDVGKICTEMDSFFRSEALLPFNGREKFLLNSLVGYESKDVTGASEKFEELNKLRSKTNEIQQSSDSGIPVGKSSGKSKAFEFKRNDLLTIVQLASCEVPKKEMDLLMYFISDVSCLLFVDKTSTKFLSTIIPLCIQDEQVRYPVISISASHRANTIETVPQYHRDAALYRAKSQGQLTKAGMVGINMEKLLLSVLLIAVQEVLEGTSLLWSIALERAAEIIHQEGGLKEVCEASPIAVQLFCYLDLISSLSTCSTPYLERTSSLERPFLYDEVDETYIEDILNCKFGFKFGIGGQLFKIIGNISTLASLRFSRHKSKIYEEQFNSLATIIELKLQEWSPPIGDIIDRYQINGSEDNGKLQLSSYTVALQWSSFLRLYQVQYGYNRKDPRVEACLSIILRSVKVIDVFSDLETSLMFPLVMAGSVAYNDDDRSYVLLRIRSIRERLKFNYIQEFEKLLTTIWSKDNEEGDMVNWASIRFFRFLGLVMF
ncbi:uncharacterized protein PRCAT00001401001 [Priceomyces carsonii]|uniref:uncharacterized protein n=1 Tax=Priceomyces carsonii TaxID=28549 RepID=UPI002EDA730D|nr:unnamed protein product [Priceomyces carsonii]